MALTDLRAYVDRLRRLGEIQDVATPVALDLELGAIVRRCYETGAPAPLFSAFADHSPGFRILGAPAGLSSRPGQNLVRVATSLEMAPDSSAREIVEALAASLDSRSVQPEIVADAPCLANVLTGDAVDLMRLPIPLLHGGDGGHYINTWGCIVARTPDGSWTNWSIARIMRLDGRRMTGPVAPQQHLGQIARAWAGLGQPMPFALALGVEPSIPFVCGMPLPEQVDEAARLGAFLRRPLRTVRCRTIALEAPASAEVLIEGHLHLDEEAEEGPMAEFAGYLWPAGAVRRPVYRVTALSYRDDAILPVVVSGEPVEENHTAWGIPTAAVILHDLRAAGLPVTMAWSPFETALHWLVVTVPPHWRRCGLDGSEAFCRRVGEIVFGGKAGRMIPTVVILPDDIDPSDTKELLWAFATRCHPLEGHSIFENAAAAPMLAYLRASEKSSASTGKIVYNCLPPGEWGEMVPIRASFRHAYPPGIVERVLRRWTTYGFDPVPGSTHERWPHPHGSCEEHDRRGAAATAGNDRE